MSDCEHDWKDEYYGSKCQKCGLFYPHGCAPWEPEPDDAMARLQQIETLDDN